MTAGKRARTEPLIHRVAGFAFALAVGVVVALYAYHRVTDPEPAMQRAKEEAVVLAAREFLRHYIDPATELRIVDPVSPDRKVGKSYIYPTRSGWEVSGHYRRSETDRWHAFLMALHSDTTLASLSVKDSPGHFAAAALEDPKFTAQP